ncbi:hypothetical protein [Arthrobacter oryzae]|jgi:hypothetical protein|uniref:hypothetical protein n=1 Tax=Arthrobacter oryzae TaxID=409290 RepID=UPI0028646250|nr:hypothetical protein [Arthrobacter oryzae]MDR6506810.1 hypothetical protein [Arthrobacter oryzae]
MSQNQEQDTILRVSSDSSNTVTLHLDASAPVTVRLQVDGGCTCEHTTPRPGSYIDSDPGSR